MAASSPHGRATSSPRGMAASSPRGRATSSLRGLLRRPFQGRRFLFGNDDGVKRSLGRGSGFGSRIFPACPRCSLGHGRRKSCIFPLCRSSSMSKLSVACACGHLLACAVVACPAVLQLCVSCRWPDWPVVPILWAGLCRFQPDFSSINQAILLLN